MAKVKLTKAMSELSVNGCESNDEEETSSLASCSTTENSRSDTPTNNTQKKGKRGRKRKTFVSPSMAYTYKCHVKEDHGTELFGVQFFNYTINHDIPVFATVGKHRVTIYECLKNGHIQPVQTYADPNTNEVYYTCAWSYDDHFKPLLAVAGSSGIIRIFSPIHGVCIREFIAHGNPINDIKFHPKDPNLLLSISKDHTLRLWNIKTCTCTVIFGIVEGHRDEVLSADICLDGIKIVSCGMDHSLKIWRLDRDDIVLSIQKSYDYTHIKNKEKPFETIEVHFPEFSTRDIHKNYVDCVMWFGDYILSKSCDNCITCWKPGKHEDSELRPNETNVNILHRFEYKNVDIWFMRFSMDFFQKTLALGNQIGKVYVWDFDHEDFSKTELTTLTHPLCAKKTIRQTSLNQNGTILVYVCDDGTVWRWDKTTRERENGSVQVMETN